MDASTTIRRMLQGNKISVPAYQRAYSWETPDGKSDKKTHTNVFLSDLNEYRKIADDKKRSPYYFGHFLFEKGQGQELNVIDGQQRLTTIVIFLCAVFTKLGSLRPLSDMEHILYEDMVTRRGDFSFLTVEYDRRILIDYVILKSKHDTNCDTESSGRIIKAYDYFTRELESASEIYLNGVIEVISNATCTTHLVDNESEAIQMFIFQNNRGKQPSNLEIVKAQFMYQVHLNGGAAKIALIEEIKYNFEKIYKSISSIDYKISEDDVLSYALKIHFNSLAELNTLSKINSILADRHAIDFIKIFTHLLAACFEQLTVFFGKDERRNFAIHSLVTLGGIGVVLPFIIKAYIYNLSIDDKCALCSSFENLVLRHRTIGTRATISTRINSVFKELTLDNKDITKIISMIEELKKSKDDWWAHWNNEKLEISIQGGLHPSVARYLLWKYEIHLRGQGMAGYSPERFESIDSPELEHIAPTKEPNTTPHGYDTYDDEFKNQYLNCLGNYLLLSGSHNCAVGNIPFGKKLVTYVHNEQQIEIKGLVSENAVWTRDVILARKNKIIKVIMGVC